MTQDVLRPPSLSAIYHSARPKPTNKLVKREEVAIADFRAPMSRRSLLDVNSSCNTMPTGNHSAASLMKRKNNTNIAKKCSRGEATKASTAAREPPDAS